MGWIKRIITSRYVKSGTRYLLVALAAYLTNIPALKPFGDYLKENMGQLSELFAGAILSVVILWSTAKNAKNGKVEKEVKKEVK